EFAQGGVHRAGIVEHECAQGTARRAMSPSLVPMPAPRNPSKMFETRSQAWKEVGLLRQISPRVVKRARLEALLLVPLFVGVVIVYDNRASLLGAAGRHGRAASELEQPLEERGTAVTVIALVILGWAIARDVGRSLG